MTVVHNRRAIIDRKSLVRELEEQATWVGFSLETRNNFLQIFRAALYRGVGEIRRRFEEENINGAEVVLADAYLVDQLVRGIYDFAIKYVYPTAGPTAGPIADPIADPAAAEPLAIAATGGYGRAELSPFSDIDLMFLLPNRSVAKTEQLVEFILYMLWDMGLKVGHATRTADDCVKLARSDLTIRTSLLEARWLWGDRALYDQFESKFMNEVVAGTGSQFVEQKLTERDARHERMGDSRYVLEPHIKEGKGGLRDLQTLFWMAKYLYQVKDMGELFERGVFTTADVHGFRRAQNFLWTVRCHLHYAADRPEERLTFTYQSIIAKRLGYNDRASGRGVERFMRHYFLITKTVGDLTRVLCAVLEEDHRKKSIRFRIPIFSLFRRAREGFQLDGGRLALEDDGLFSRDPVKILQLFHEAQRQELDIHPHAVRLVHQNLRYVDASLRENADANRLFMEMLTSENDPETTLKRLNDAGVFGRFVPDFGRVVAQMQYDMYHVYTVDEHTIRAIGILHLLERGDLKEQHPTASAVVGDMRSRRALYMAVLLHDIAKGRGGDHSEIGAQIALYVCPRFGLDDWETETVSWLVRYHLLMSRTAFKRDVDNPKTVTDFNAEVQSPERLRMLLVLTEVDIRAVGPNIWNAWKGGLLGELYYRALEEMEMTGGQPVERRTIRVERAKAKLRERLSEWDEAALENAISRGYPDYWLAFDTDDQARHFEMMRESERKGEPLHVESRHHPTLDVTEIVIYSPDHPGLFAHIAGAMALTGASIVDAKVFTLANGMALDTFWIQDVSGAAFDSPERIARLTGRIERAVKGSLWPARELEAVRLNALPSRTGIFTVSPAVIIDNKASTGHTVIEVNARDRQGLLHDVTSAITDLNLQIVSAHVSTYGERAVDVFYLKDVFGLKIDDPSKLRRIERRLRAAIAPPDDRATSAKKKAAAAE